LPIFTCDAEFLQKLIKDKELQQLKLDLTFRYIDDVLSINNRNIAKWIPLLYPKELGIKETSETAFSALFLDIYL